MWRCMTGAVTVGVLLASALWSGTCGAEPTAKEIAAMQGTWTIESFTLNGQSVPAGQLQNWRRIVTGGHVTWKNGDELLVEMDITFDPQQKPMTLDSTIATGDAKGKVVLAIYELDGDTLRVCFADPDKPRPTEFSSAPGSGPSLYVAKRVKE